MNAFYDPDGNILDVVFDSKKTYYAVRQNKLFDHYIDRKTQKIVGFCLNVGAMADTINHGKLIKLD